ncbi:hypothetical protein K431DRAFT_317378 [Polychaeton citri CBS 116435]|uniref:Sequence orphan n=1 Tax=Polychaeton citri CBS 116435 TaxID=1314669 RepID=A0A9P4QGE1_9PEZI|nr:hypothetical protein K431DRAFT_317378 [Polychaeton citri CBS 116435]
MAANTRKTAEWNTKNLGGRLLVDAGSAATAGGLVAPLVSMIDRAIMENASGKNTLGRSLADSLRHLLLRPHQYLTARPFALILMVYSSTYLAANTLDTARATAQGTPASSVSSGPAKFAATSFTNMGMGLYKDSQFTKMFGTAAARPIPPASYALFALRDSLTVFASFNLPPILAPSLPLSEAAETYVSRATAAQFLAPAAVQVISTPMHLLGLDLYNRNGGTPMSDRLRKVRVDWLKSSIARMCRIVPAFGFGGVVNTRLRAKLMKKLE